MNKKIFKYLTLFINQSSILVGGQAVIEGVLMRVPGAYATAVRDKDNNILIDKHDFKSKLEKYNLKNIIILRGVIGLFESLQIGFKTLQWSADIAEENDANNKTNPIVEILLTIFSILFVITLFFIGPLGITRLIIDENLNPLNFNIIAGIFRITFFLIYLIVISKMQDVHTLFQYHGAEHKTVYNFESGKQLEVKTAQSFPTQHPRCGTSFVFIVMIIGILTFTVIDSILLAYFNTMNLFINSLITRVIIHILFMPLVAGFGYEVLKLTAKYKSNIILQALARPGLWLQNITTKQPNDHQLEVAIAALKAAFGDSIKKYEGKEHIAEAIE